MRESPNTKKLQANISSRFDALAAFASSELESRKQSRRKSTNNSPDVRGSWEMQKGGQMPMAGGFAPTMHDPHGAMHPVSGAPPPDLLSAQLSNAGLACATSINPISLNPSPWQLEFMNKLQNTGEIHGDEKKAEMRSGTEPAMFVAGHYTPKGKKPIPLKLSPTPPPKPVEADPPIEDLAPPKTPGKDFEESIFSSSGPKPSGTVDGTSCSSSSANNATDASKYSTAPSEEDYADVQFHKKFSRKGGRKYCKPLTHNVASKDVPSKKQNANGSSVQKKEVDGLKTKAQSAVPTVVLQRPPGHDPPKLAIKQQHSSHFANKGTPPTSLPASSSSTSSSTSNQQGNKYSNSSSNQGKHDTNLGPFIELRSAGLKQVPNPPSSGSSHTPLAILTTSAGTQRFTGSGYYTGAMPSPGMHPQPINPELLDRSQARGNTQPHPGMQSSNESYRSPFSTPPPPPSSRGTPSSSDSALSDTHGSMRATPPSHGGRGLPPNVSPLSSGNVPMPGGFINGVMQPYGVGQQTGDLGMPTYIPNAANYMPVTHSGHGPSYLMQYGTPR